MNNHFQIKILFALRKWRKLLWVGNMPTVTRQTENQFSIIFWGSVSHSIVSGLFPFMFCCRCCFYFFFYFLLLMIMMIRFFFNITLFKEFFIFFVFIYPACLLCIDNSFFFHFYRIPIWMSGTLCLYLFLVPFLGFISFCSIVLSYSNIFLFFF